MKTLKMYYVYDNLNECVITPPIPCPNSLVAAIGFRDAYIKKDSKYNYTALDLVQFACFDVDEDGCMMVSSRKDYNEIIRIQGKDILNFIKEESQKLGIDDNFVENISEE